mmetsp:Transcript_33112/g.53183  ORF Transcript_33112/g.53183 Transcript_33112/m.53183 type:complete len:555 (-) Transcript_33112:164-1828(-)
MRSQILQDARDVLSWTDEVSIYAFGSHANGFDVRGSDLDITAISGTLRKPPKGSREKDNVKFLRSLRKTIRKHGANAKKKNKKVKAGLPYFKHARLIIARVPVLNTKHHPSYMEVDIVAYNRLGVLNSELLATYASLHPLVQSLGRLVKRWAKIQNIGSARDNGLSSYAWVLLAIFHLQMLNIIPSLQSPHLIKSEPRVQVNGFNCTFCRGEKELTQAKKHAMTMLRGRDLSDLFYGFLERLNSIEWGSVCISVRKRRLCDRPQHILAINKNNARIKGNKLIWIEDPFELSHNLGKAVGVRSMRLIVQAIQSTLENLRVNPPTALISSTPPRTRRESRKEKREKRKANKSSKPPNTQCDTPDEGDERTRVVVEMIDPHFAERVKAAALHAKEATDGQLEYHHLDTLDDRQNLSQQAAEAARELGFPSKPSLLSCILTEFFNTTPDTDKNGPPPSPNLTCNNAAIDSALDASPDQLGVLREFLDDNFIMRALQAARKLILDKKSTLVDVASLSNTQLKSLDDSLGLRRQAGQAAKMLGFKNGREVLAGAIALAVS